MNSLLSRIGVGLVASIAMLASGCDANELFGPPQTAVARQRPYRPVTLSLYEVAGDRANGAAQLAEVVGHHVWPREVVIGTEAQTSPSVTTYTVRAGESLARIAAANGLPLAALEATNPALGPSVGDRVSIPGPQTAVLRQDFIVQRLPAGAAPPTLLVPPTCPTNTTSFLHAQCRDDARKDAQLNSAREAAWWASEARQLEPVQADLVRRLRGIAAEPAAPAGISGSALSDSIRIGANTLSQLPSRRVLLLTDVGDGGPPHLEKGELKAINLVVTGVTDPSASAAWTVAGGGAGAASTVVLSPALTQLNLVASVMPPAS